MDKYGEKRSKTLQPKPGYNHNNININNINTHQQEYSQKQQ